MLNYDITQPLPGWIRFQNADTGKIIDINPQHYAHRLLLERYSKNPNGRSSLKPPSFNRDGQPGIIRLPA
jgi:hypothetical protein